MFEYLHGTVSEKSPATAVIDVHGVGYLLDIPVSTYDRLPPAGGDAKVFVHYHVREDSQRLFGFATLAEREVFRQLISISNIGPKTALSVLSHLSINELALAVAASDASRLKSVPGVGLKTAQRLIVELKGKLALPADSNGAGEVAGLGKAAGAGFKPASVSAETFDAMMSLGYSEPQVQKALARVAETIDGSAPIEEWIRRALQVI